MSDTAEPQRLGGSREGELSSVVHRNIRALLDARQMLVRNDTVEQRISDAITRFTGSMWFVYLHAAVLVLWFVVNLGLVGLKPFDPYPFVLLAMSASVEAIFLSTFVLMSQNRSNYLADRRADLNLQIDLLSEHEVTRLIRLVDAVAQRLGVVGEDVEELKRDVEPQVMLREIDRAGRAEAARDGADQERPGGENTEPEHH
jgi:uncharacterized membrane protein